MTSGCYSDLQLAMYHGQDLPDPECTQISNHIRDCDDCQQRYEQQALSDRLLSDLRQLNRTTRTAGLLGQRAMTCGTDAIAGYDIVREIQRGGQGIVYEAVQLATKRRVALKVLSEGPFADARQRRRFESEIELASGFQHPNIVAIHDSGLVQGHFYYAMEFIDGDRLDGYVRERNLSTHEIVRLFRVICEAVGYAHRYGVIHRDIKPSNIKVTQDGTPYLLDFGLARHVGHVGGVDRMATLTHEFVGTVAYASPEQTQSGTGRLGTTTDVYSLGVVFYELLTNQYPYPVTDNLVDTFGHIRCTDPMLPRSSGNQLDGELEAILLKALEKDPQRRYPTASHLSDDIDRYLNGDPIAARPATAAYIAGRLIKKNQSVLVSVASVLILVVGLLVWRHLSVSAEREATLAAQSARIAAAQQHEQASAWYQEAVDLIRRDVLHDRALFLLDNATRIDPTLAVAFFERGQLKLRMAKDAVQPDREKAIWQAVRDFEKAHAASGGDWLSDPRSNEPISPADAQALPVDQHGRLIGFADVYKRRDGSLVQTNKHGQDESVGGPGYARALVAAGDALRDMHAYDQASVYYDKAMKLDPGDIYVQIGQAVMIAMHDDHSDAAIDQLEALTKNRVAVVIHELWYALAYVHIAKGPADAGHIDRAIECLYKTVELSPNHAHAWTELGRILRDPMESEAALQQALMIDSKHVEAWFVLGKTYLDQSDLDAAIRCFDRAIDIHYNHMPSVFHLGLALKEQNKRLQAAKLLTRVVEHDESNALAWAHLGSMAFDRGAFDIAFENYELAVSYDPSLVWVWELLVRHYGLLGDQELAQCYADAALQANPEHAAVTDLMQSSVN